MRQIRLRLLRWVIGFLGKSHSGAAFVRFDGAKVDVDCCSCTTCKNYFWFAAGDIESPSGCPFCLTKFDFITPISAEEMRDNQSGL